MAILLHIFSFMSYMQTRIPSAGLTNGLWYHPNAFKVQDSNINIDTINIKSTDLLPHHS